MTSIIVPVYNGIRTIEYCIRSVQEQTAADWELILVDDGSTNGCGALCDRLASEDIRIRVIHKPNGGVSSARNAGIEAATGEYLVFCDSDDYLEPDYLEWLLSTAKANPDCGHIWCCFQTVSGYEKEDPIPNFTAKEDIQRFTCSGYMTLHEMWLDTEPWNKLFRAEVVKEHAVRFPEDLSLGEDWLFNMAYMDASGNDKIAVITKPLYNYVRSNETSLDSKYRSDLLDIYRRLSAACLLHLEKWNVSVEQMDKFYNSRFYMYEKVLRNTMCAPDKSKREKIRWNTAFMKSAEFHEVLRKRTCVVHPLYLTAYRSGNYNNVLRVEGLSKLYRKWKNNRK